MRPHRLSARTGGHKLEEFALQLRQRVNPIPRRLEIRPLVRQLLLDIRVPRPRLLQRQRGSFE
jgi:hypothetical protein